MTKPSTPMKKQQRAHYTDAYREEALLLAEWVDVTTAARDLGLQPSQIYQWRTKAQQRKTVTDREQTLADENALIKRQRADMAEGQAIAKKGSGMLNWSSQH
ncbi:MAG: transposase [Gammaproteobacteria bacterium]|nr:transposase [Gammaproteobacteria bacterium]